MAGAGKRFIDSGYKIPKPLIDIDGLPMVVRAAKCMPVCDLWVFICRKEHIEFGRIDLVLNANFNPCIIISVDHLTEGQASTCLLAREYILDDDILNIGACDNAIFWNKKSYYTKMNDDKIDVLVWSFRHHPAVIQNPNMYGWIKTNEMNLIENISVKKTISMHPYDDYAITGNFTFKRATIFFDACYSMINAHGRVNNEYYIDTAINYALLRGRVACVFLVDKYICWGTPIDLKYYEYWNSYFKYINNT